jgi:hypothetical protein
MMLLFHYVAVGLVAAFAIAIPVGYCLARLLAIEPPRRRAALQKWGPAPSVEIGPEVSVAKLGTDIGQSIAQLVRDLDRMGTVVLREGDHGKQIGVLMSVEQYELLHATEKLANDPDHLVSLVTVRTGDNVEPEVNWRAVLA